MHACMGGCYNMLLLPSSCPLTSLASSLPLFCPPCSCAKMWSNNKYDNSCRYWTMEQQ